MSCKVIFEHLSLNFHFNFRAMLDMKREIEFQRKLNAIKNLEIYFMLPSYLFISSISFMFLFSKSTVTDNGSGSGRMFSGTV